MAGAGVRQPAEPFWRRCHVGPSTRDTEWLSDDSLHGYSHDGAARDVSMMEELGLRPLGTQEGDAPSASRTGLRVLRAGPRQCPAGGAAGAMGAGPVWSHPASPRWRSAACPSHRADAAANDTPRSANSSRLPRSPRRGLAVLGSGQVTRDMGLNCAGLLMCIL